MKKKRYDVDFSAALIAASGCIGVVIPPSVPMVLYAVIAGESVAKLFLGGFIPGTFMGISLIAYAVWYAHRQGYPASEPYTLPVVLKRLLASLWGLATPVLILGGIFSGYFTPSEAAAMAVVYTLLIAAFVYRTLTFRQFYELVVGAGVTSALIMFIIGTAKIFGWCLAFYAIPEAVAAAVVKLAGNNPGLIYFLIVVLILIAGFFMETASALIILTPIFLPLIAAVGGDLVHFGVVMTIGLAIGMATPPMAINIFVASAISGRTIEQISRSIWPMVAALVVILLLCTYFPRIGMILPELPIASRLRVDAIPATDGEEGLCRARPSYGVFSFSLRESPGNNQSYLGAIPRRSCPKQRSCSRPAVPPPVGHNRLFPQ